VQLVYVCGHPFHIFWHVRGRIRTIRQSKDGNKDTEEAWKMGEFQIRTATGCSVRHYSPSYKKKSIILLTRGSVMHHKELFIR
jgi:hypothetical protein